MDRQQRISLATPLAVVVMTLMLTLGAVAIGSATAAQAERDDRKGAYLHAFVWNRALPGLAGELLLTVEARAEAQTGTGFGTSSDPVHPAADLHFAIDSLKRDGDQITIQGRVIQANDPANLGLPIGLLAKFHGINTTVRIAIGKLTFQGAGFINPNIGL